LHELIEKLDQFLPEGFADLDKETLIAAAERLIRNWKSAEASNYREFVRIVVKKVTLGESNVWILVSTRTLIEKLIEKNLRSDIQIPSLMKDVTVSAEFRTLRRGVVLQLISPQNEQIRKQPLPSSLQMVARARIWYERIVSGEVQSIEALAKEVRMTPRSIRRVLRWAALSPQLIESIVRGDYRPNITTKRYLKEFPLDWQTQQNYFSQTSV
jgi:hypothetical protein